MRYALFDSLVVFAAIAGLAGNLPAHPDSLVIYLCDCENGSASGGTAIAAVAIGHLLPTI